MPLEGLQLGKYRLVRLIGSGGMGDVYMGEDARLSRHLAIKVMRAEVSPYPDEDAVKEAARLFQREMKAIARLDHPHILPLYDYGEELLHQTTLIYMVMPFRPEGSLADWLRQRNTPEPLPLQDIASLVSQSSEALQYAHDQQIIHQDIKLSNFLIRRKKDVSSPPDLQLADFGIAKIGSATSSVSHASRGTPISMAPEQWNGDPVPATDQYALAIMTYELLTGRPPFRGRPEQMMYQHLTVPPPPPSTFRKDLPASIDAVLLHALAKKPQERFASISAFAVAFQQAMQSTGDLYATLAISEGEAATGTQRELMLPGGRKAQVSIPQRVQDKQVLRLEGLGEPYYAGGPLGALVLTLAISSQDKTALAKEAVYDETVASSGSSYRAGTKETIDEPAPPPSETSAVGVDPQLAQKSKPSIPTGEPPPAAAAPSSLAEPVLPKTPPSREPAPALEKEKATAPSQALLPTEPVAPPRSLIEPTVPASLSPSAPMPLQLGQVPEHLMPEPAQSRRRKVPPRAKIAIVSLVFLIVVIVGASVAYTIISTSTFNSALNTAVAAARATATAGGQAGNPYGGTLVASDSMSGPGSAFAWDVRNDQYGQCNFKNGAYHVFGICDGSASISTKFAFEIYLNAGGNCGNLDFYSHSAPVYADVTVCQNGSYDLSTDVTAANGKVTGTTPAMRTGTDQSNIIGIVSDGTHVILFINYVRVDSVAGVYTDLFSLKLDGYALGSDGMWSANSAEVAYTDARLWSL